MLMPMPYQYENSRPYFALFLMILSYFFFSDPNMLRQIPLICVPMIGMLGLYWEVSLQNEKYSLLSLFHNLSAPRTPDC